MLPSRKPWCNRPWSIRSATIIRWSELPQSRTRCPRSPLHPGGFETPLRKTTQGQVMSIEVKVPVLPESVSDATIATWHKKPGDAVKRDENLVDLETDKVVLEVPAPADGVLKEIRHDTGDTVNSQDVIGILEEGAVAEAPKAAAEKKEPRQPEAPARAEAPAKAAGT